MKISGIICEYNPLHLGHKKQLDLLRANDPEGGIVCLMSGNFVQRGAPAIFDKLLRAKASVLSGADLVLELPVTAALNSAEGFAARGVEILSRFCHRLCFGAEDADDAYLMALANALLSPEFPEVLHQELDKGLSFPAARQAALEAMGMDASSLALPNNILAVEYCKAILAQRSSIQPFVIHRQGDYHGTTPDKESPSATFLRQQLTQGGDWAAFVPHQAVPCFDSASVHSLKYGEKAILGKLRTMTETEFQALPFGSEGLWRKLMHAAREQATLEDIISAVKSKRYTRTRLDRMVMCAFLGITQKDLDTPAPYVRALAFNDRGRQILRAARAAGSFPNIGETQKEPYALLEERCSSLYGLFCQFPESPDREHNYRVFYQK